MVAGNGELGKVSLRVDCLGSTSGARLIMIRSDKVMPLPMFVNESKYAV